jgi:hypothetical protein
VKGRAKGLAKDRERPLLTTFSVSAKKAVRSGGKIKQSPYL